MSEVNPQLLDSKEIIKQAFADPSSIGNGVMFALFKQLVEKSKEYGLKLRKNAGEQESYRKMLKSIDFVITDDLTKEARAQYVAAAKSLLGEGQELPADFEIPSDLPLGEPHPTVKRIREAIAQQEVDAANTYIKLGGEKKFCDGMIQLMRALTHDMEEKIKAGIEAAAPDLNPSALEEVISQAAKSEDPAKATPATTQAPPAKTEIQILVEEYRAAGKCTWVDMGEKAPCGNKPASKSTEYCRKHK